MAFWRRHKPLQQELRERFTQANPRDPVVAKWFGLQNNTESGVYVNEDVARAVTAVYACVKVLSESVAILPWTLREDMGKDGDVETDYYIDEILRKRPNNWQTPFEFKQMLMGHVVLRGAAYCYKDYGPDGKLRQLIPLHPDRTSPFKAPDDTRAFVHQPLVGPKRIYLQDEIFFVPGQTDDGYKPLSVLGYAKEAIGLAYATQQYGSRFFKNNANPGGILQHPAKMGDVAYQRLKDDWQARHQGGHNAHKVAILEEGMTWQTVGMTAQDAQFVESRKQSPIEICQIFRVPPHKIAILDRATFSNIEHQSLEFVVDTLMSYLLRFEEGADRDLLQNSNEKKYFTQFDVSAMLRGDMATRYTAYNSAIQNRWMSRNEVRKREGLTPIPDGDGFEVPNMSAQPAAFPKSEPKNPKSNEGE